MRIEYVEVKPRTCTSPLSYQEKMRAKHLCPLLLYDLRKDPVMYLQN
jgi:hypothetical protein